MAYHYLYVIILKVTNLVVRNNVDNKESVGVHAFFIYLMYDILNKELTVVLFT